jgi:hypothetical protein
MKLKNVNPNGDNVVASNLMKVNILFFLTIVELVCWAWAQHILSISLPSTLESTKLVTNSSFLKTCYQSLQDYGDDTKKKIYCL